MTLIVDLIQRLIVTISNWQLQQILFQLTRRLTKSRYQSAKWFQYTFHIFRYIYWSQQLPRCCWLQLVVLQNSWLLSLFYTLLKEKVISGLTADF